MFFLWFVVVYIYNQAMGLDLVKFLNGIFSFLFIMHGQGDGDAGPVRDDGEEEERSEKSDERIQ